MTALFSQGQEIQSGPRGLLQLYVCTLPRDLVYVNVRIRVSLTQHALVA